MRIVPTACHYGIVLVLVSVPVATEWLRSSESQPEVKRQWLFHCGGWGPGCMKTAAAKVRLFSHLNFNPTYRTPPATEGKFQPTFILTSGSSWGAIGKRSLIPNKHESLRQLLLYVLLSKTGFMYKEMLYRQMLRRYMRQRLRTQVPQLS